MEVQGGESQCGDWEHGLGEERLQVEIQCEWIFKQTHNNNEPFFYLSSIKSKIILSGICEVL